MSITKKIFIFFIGFLCAWVIFSMGVKKGACQINILPNILFSADNSNFYFLDRDESKVYMYNLQGKLSHTYIIIVLGKVFLYK
jgi:hypothetical protein